GSTAHVLAIDYALRPVLSSLAASHILPGLFVLDRHITKDDEPGPVVEEARAEKLLRLADDLSTALTRTSATAITA
ncbi:NADPH-dependent FMN reductase, partial [Streptomyces sp. NRRL F-6602]